jgi:dipeptidase E
MKLLLTDSGVRNASILAALAGMLGKPIAEASALCIPTAGPGYGALTGTRAGHGASSAGGPPVP